MKKEPQEQQQNVSCLEHRKLPIQVKQEQQVFSGNQQSYPQLQKTNYPHVPPAQQVNNSQSKNKQVHFGLLLPTIMPHLEKDKAWQLNSLFTKLRNNEINKDGFVKQMRSIVGDKMLRMAFHAVQTKEVAKDLAAQNSQTAAQQFQGQRPLADSSQVSSSTGQLQTSSSLSKHQQQHMHIAQPSYSIYGTNMGNYPAHAFPGAPASAGLASLGPQSQDSQMRQPTLHHGMGSSQIGGVSQPMNMMNALKYDSQTSNGESKRFHGGPLPGGHVDVEMWDENPPLVGKASLFEPIGEFILYGCEGYVKVYNFHVAPGDVSLYKKIVEQHGHIPNQSVSHEMNILVSNTRVVLGVTRDVQSLGESLPSRKQLQAWNLGLEIARTLKFHMSWLEEMLSSLETKLESHKATLPAEIAGLEADVAALHMDIEYHKATKDRLAKQATEIAKQAAAAAAKVEAVGRAIAAKKKLLQEKRDEFAAVS